MSRFNKKEYLKLLVAGKIDYEERKIYDLIEKYNLINNKKFILEIKLFREFLKYSSEELRKDKEFILEVVKQDGFVLEYASEELKNDKEIVLEAVKQNGNALGYACDRLKNDKEVMIEAVKQNGCALEYASDRLKNDKDFILEILQKILSKNMTNDWIFEFYKEAILSYNLKNDRNFIFEAVKVDSRALQWASDRLKDDADLIELLNKQKNHLINDEENPYEDFGDDLPF